MSPGTSTATQGPSETTQAASGLDTEAKIGNGLGISIAVGVMTIMALVIYRRRFAKG